MQNKKLILQHKRGILTRPITAEITMAARVHWIVVAKKFIISIPEKKMHLLHLSDREK